MGSQAASLLRKTPARGLRASPDQFSALDRPHPAAQEPRIPAPAIDASRRTSFKSLTGIPVFPPEEGTRTFSSSRLPIQFKLAIGAANDPLEAEADAMAAGVMGMAPNAPASTGTATPVLRRKCSCGGEKCDKCKQEQEGQIQRKAAASVTPREAPPIVHETLRSPGQPLDSSTRSFFEPRFKRDFSSVRVHADDKAAESARSVNALAYTIGPHLVFGPGQYAPSAPAGRELLAHELAHVMQQKEGHTLVHAPANRVHTVQLQRRSPPSWLPPRVSRKMSRRLPGARNFVEWSLLIPSALLMDTAPPPLPSPTSCGRTLVPGWATSLAST